MSFCTTHKEYLVVSVTVQNLVRISAVVSTLMAVKILNFQKSKMVDWMATILQEAQLPLRDPAVHNFSKFVLQFMCYGSYKDFK